MAGLQNTRKGLPTLEEAMAIVKAARPQIAMAVPESVGKKRYNAVSGAARFEGIPFEDIPYPEKMLTRVTEAPRTVFENKDLHRYIQSDPVVGYGTTNLGANPGAYIDPAGAILVERDGRQNVTTAFGDQITEAAHYQPNNRGTGMITVHEPYLAGNGNSAYEQSKALTHENIHRNQDRWDMVYPRQTPGLSMVNINATKKAALRDRLDQALWHERGVIPDLERQHGNFYYGPSEPVAYMGGEEALLPQGQLPVRDALKKYRLEKLYDLMVTRGPVASSREPTINERFADWAESVGLKNAK